MKFKITNHNNYWLLHVVLHNETGVLYCYTRRQLFPTREAAQEMMALVWRAHPTTLVLDKSPHWFERKRSSSDKLVFVEEYWRRLPRKYTRKQSV